MNITHCLCIHSRIYMPKELHTLNCRIRENLYSASLRFGYSESLASVSRRNKTKLRETYPRNGSLGSERSVKWMSFQIAGPNTVSAYLGLHNIYFFITPL